MKQSRTIWPDAKFYVWKGMNYNGPGNEWTASPCPEPGTSAPMGSDWQEVDTQQEADVIDVPYTVWGDYVGSTVERSNFRAFVEDYPDTFVEIYGDYGSHCLYLPTFKLSADLVEAIRHLFDYPLYDEQDHSMLENDIAWEAWDGYLKFDINREIPDDLGSDDWTDEEWEFFKQRYYTLTYEQNYGPECEDAVSAYFPFHDEVMELLVDEIRTLGFEHDPRRPNPNQLTLENSETE